MERILSRGYVPITTALGSDHAATGTVNSRGRRRTSRRVVTCDLSCGLTSALSEARHLRHGSKRLYPELQHPFTHSEATGRALAPARCQARDRQMVGFLRTWNTASTTIR